MWNEVKIAKNTEKTPDYLRKIYGDNFMIYNFPVREYHEDFDFFLSAYYRTGIFAWQLYKKGYNIPVR